MPRLGGRTNGSPFAGKYLLRFQKPQSGLLWRRSVRRWEMVNLIKAPNRPLCITDVVKINKIFYWEQLNVYELQGLGSWQKFCNSGLKISETSKDYSDCCSYHSAKSESSSGDFSRREASKSLRIVVTIQLECAGTFHRCGRTASLYKGMLCLVFTGLPFIF